ncbi:RNA methyltransferase, TrmH family [Solitalea koreensis]|uniref:RNA methyltransferase, TrmH family n=2 Tax=Solitalea koreensis TaxID=543615 RepID=A0A521D6P3_9SPHI|nr:RNA methyltransferase, TrmH family [Solitalea koreensis]
MVFELLQSGYIVQSLFLTENYLNQIKSAVKLPKYTEIHIVSETDLQKISQLQTANEVLAVVNIPQSYQDGSLNSDAIKDKWTIMLDNVQDPGNMGTIIRIADWFAIDTIICSTTTVDMYNPKVVQSTMGSLFRVNVVKIDLEDFLHKVKLPVYGALLEGENVYQQNISKAGILLMGNESKGISPELKKYINNPVMIPRFGQAESLNVGIATAILCSEIRRG